MTIEEIIQANTIITAAQTCAKVAWVTHGEIRYGTARSIGDEQGQFAHGDAEFIGQYLRVTGREGFEYFLSVRHLMPKVASGEFAIYEW